MDRLNDNYGHSPTENPPEASGTEGRAIIKDESLVPPGPGQNALNLPTAPILDSGEEQDLVPPKPDPNFRLYSDEEDDLELSPVPPSNNFYQINF